MSLVPDSQSQMFEVPVTQVEDFHGTRLGSQMVDLPGGQLDLDYGQDRSKKNSTGTTMKWAPFLSTLLLNKMVEIIKTGV